jgi:hypothetical protein
LSTASPSVRKPKPERASTSVRFEPRLLRLMDRHAKKERLSRTQVVCRAIEAYFGLRPPAIPVPDPNNPA